MKRSAVYIALFAVAAALFLLNFYLWQVQEAKKMRIEGLQEQIALHLRENKSLHDRNNDLRVEIDTLRSPDSYYSYEEKAREDYGLIGENETFFVLSEADIAMVDDVPGLSTQDKNQSFTTVKPAAGSVQLESVSADSDVSVEQEIEPIAVSPIPLQLESLSAE